MTDGAILSVYIQNVSDCKKKRKMEIYTTSILALPELYVYINGAKYIGRIEKGL